MLIALVTSRRASSLKLLTTKEGFCEISESSARFQPFNIETSEGQDHFSGQLEFNAYIEDPRICPVAM